MSEPFSLTLCTNEEMPRLLQSGSFDAVIGLHRPCKESRALRTEWVKHLSGRARIGLFVNYNIDDFVRLSSLIQKLVDFAAKIKRGTKVLVHGNVAKEHGAAAAVILLREHGANGLDARAQVRHALPANKTVLDCYQKFDNHRNNVRDDEWSE